MNKQENNNCNSSKGYCVTCSDEAVAAKVVEIVEPQLAKVEFNGELVEIDISLLEEVQPGDMILIHAGVALSVENN